MTVEERMKSMKRRIAITIIALSLSLGLALWRQKSPVAAKTPPVPAPINVAAGDVNALIAAIKDANDETTHPGPDTINLAGGTYTFSAAENWEFGPNALPIVTSNITIEGSGAVLKSTEATRLRFFYVAGNSVGSLPTGTLTLRDLTLQNGKQQGGNGGGGGGAGMGGAIFNHGNLTLERVTLTRNSARGGNGGEIGGGAGTGQDSQGTTGGGFGGTPTGTGGNGGVIVFKGGGGGGGGFRAGDNGISSPGGGRGANGGGAGLLGGNGGAASSIAATLGGDGGGGGHTTGAAGGANYGIGAFNCGGGGVGGGGGARGNSDGSGSGGGGGFGGGGGGGRGPDSGGDGGFGGGGGGVSRDSTDSRISIGGSGGFGAGRGGIFISGRGFFGGGGGGGLGGAIFNHLGTLSLINCTLTDNTAQGGDGSDAKMFVTGSGTGGDGGSGLGGALFNLNGTVTVTNATLAANTVTAGAGGTGVGGAADGGGGQANGGAIYNLAYGNTFAGGVTAAAVTLRNSILANSVGGNDLINDQRDSTTTPAVGAGDNTATVDYGGRNVVRTSDALSGASFTGALYSTADPLLGALANNGGLTRTMAPAAGSPVLDKGVNTDAPSTDQRGITRPQNDVADIGAVELVTNSAPTINAISIARAAGSPGGSSKIGAVNDAEDAENTLTVTATPLGGSGVTLSGVSVDSGGNVTANVAASCGATTSTFTLRVTDSGNLFAEATLTVTVTPDAIPPVITLYGADPMTVECPFGFVDPGAAATDNCGGVVPVTVSGSVNTAVPGSYIITYKATDGVNLATKTRTVKVVDTTAPELTLKPGFQIWPPNHKYQTVTMSQMVKSVSDGCGTGPGVNNVVIEKVTSDEPDNAPGDADGNTTDDIVIAADCKSVQLRSERDETKNGRVYVITLRVKDAAGNTTRKDFIVSVPLNQSGVAPVQDVTAVTKTGSCP
jgi:hypothetical protein